jgi:Zinc-binding dehydrogenase
MLLDQIFGAEVIGVDASDTQLERAASFGIRTVVDGRHPRVSDEIRRITGDGVTASFEFVGALPVVEQAVRSLAYNGTCSVVGVGPERLQLSLRQETLVARGLRILGSHGYVTADIRQLLDWISAGRLSIGTHGEPPVPACGLCQRPGYPAGPLGQRDPGGDHELRLIPQSVPHDTPGSLEERHRVAVQALPDRHVDLADQRAQTSSPARFRGGSGQAPIQPGRGRHTPAMPRSGTRGRAPGRRWSTSPSRRRRPPPGDGRRT